MKKNLQKRYKKSKNQEKTAKKQRKTTQIYSNLPPNRTKLTQNLKKQQKNMQIQEKGCFLWFFVRLFVPLTSSNVLSLGNSKDLEPLDKGRL